METVLASAKAKQAVVSAYSFVESVSLEELLQLAVLFPTLKLYLDVLLQKVHPTGPGHKNEMHGKKKCLLPSKYRTKLYKLAIVPRQDTEFPFCTGKHKTN